jgi:IS1 family transposase
MFGGLSRSAQGVKGKARILDELWTFLKVRRGQGRNVWASLVAWVPFFTVGDRDYELYRLPVTPCDVNYSDQYQVHQPGQARHGQGAHRGELQLPPQVD